MSGLDIHQLAAAYALDAVDERERAAFEAHYPTCAICRPEVAGFRETLSQVAAAVAVPPPASLKADVMAEISATRQLSQLVPNSVVDLGSYRQRRQRVLRMVTAAAAVILMAAGAFVVGRQSGDGDGYAAAAAAVLARTDTRIATLDGAGTGTFKVAWSPSANQVVVMGDDLADPGVGKAYELWRIDDAGPHAVRLLDKADGGQVRRVVTVDGSPGQWAVTVEPEGGVDAPTGEVIFVSAV
ncbi:MAG: anti-sigma factor [Actinomycetota bacterium]|nr:anti-sigma factor [Actinomycetota bacterium]